MKLMIISDIRQEELSSRLLNIVDDQKNLCYCGSASVRGVSYDDNP